MHASVFKINANSNVGIVLRGMTYFDNMII